MKIRFWGTRGSIAAPGRHTVRYGGNTTCVEFLMESGKRVVIDAGTGIRLLGEKLAAEGEKVDILLLVTHIHWDHVLGFPFFAPIYDSRCKIRVDGLPNCLRGLRFTFDNQLGDGFFPVKFEELKADIRYLGILKKGPLQIDGAVIEPIPLNHPHGGFGYRFQEKGKTAVFVTDNELRGAPWPGRHLEDYVAPCREADILIHDAQYLPEEIEERRGWGHSDYVGACTLAVQAHAERLVLFHHDPSRKDGDVARIAAAANALVEEMGAAVEVEAAEEGSEISV